MLNNDWDYRFKVTSDNTKVADSIKGLAIDLSNAPVEFWSNVKSDGSDIRVTSGETTEVARDVISIDTSGQTGLLRVDTSGISTSADSDYYVYYGNASADEPEAGSTYGQYNAYYSQTEALYEVENNANDQSKNNNTGSLIDSPSFSTDSPYGKHSLNLDDSTQSLEIPHITGLRIDSSEPFSYGVWFKGSESGNALSSISYNNNPHRGVDIWNNGSGELATHIIHSWSDDAIKVITDSSGDGFTNFNNGAWHLIGITYDGSKSWTGVTITVSGGVQPTYQTNDNLSSNQLWDSEAPSRIGGRSDDSGNGSHFQSGLFKGFRVYKNLNISSNQWTTMYHNELDNDSFWTFGAQEEVGSAGSTVTTINGVIQTSNEGVIQTK